MLPVRAVASAGGGPVLGSVLGLVVAGVDRGHRTGGVEPGEQGVAEAPIGDPTEAGLVRLTLADS